ncbi:GAF domain-containing protein [Streptomyces sp. NPDC127084]|uniref:sensor histidine kinase n=1 Tax=Streptomyces sp. NPDC127084 TaxID=3347133 RepID=UPI00364D477C
MEDGGDVAGPPQPRSAEVPTRVVTARQGGNQLQALHEAISWVAAEQALPRLLLRIAQAAVALVDAQHGALGVLGSDGRLSQFLTVGLTEEEAAAMGPYPSGEGVLGEVIRNPEPLRLDDLSRHPASCGFPEHHPPMRPSLGVPVKAGGRVFAILYLTEKQTGQTFDQDDQAAVSALAAASGMAIDSTQSRERAAYFQQWLDANAEMSSGLLSGVDEREWLGPRALELIAGHACRILAADLGLVLLPVDSGDDLYVGYAVGVGSAAHLGAILPSGGTLAKKAIAAKDVICSDATSDPGPLAGLALENPYGPVVAVPMRTRQSVRGVLILARSVGQIPFTRSETEPLMGFVGSAALAIELTERKHASEELALLEDHDRIARDLHDVAIQRLFATGMTVQSVLRFVERPEVRERLLRAVDDLDETTSIIRSAVFGIRRHNSGSRQGLRVGIVQIVEDALPQLSFTPALRMDGLIDTVVPTAVAEHLLAVLREALSNIARHAHAGAAEVSVVVEDESLTLTVTDNGIGVSKNAPHSGLANLEDRARLLGGSLSVQAAPPWGTRLTWRVPLPAH